jgi:GMP synthase-like glutamine amidotransferase
LKPVLIFEHIETGGPGLFENFLNDRSIPYQILRPNQGDQVPDISHIINYSGLCFLGGIESVIEPTEPMLKEIHLIETAVDIHMPVIGHCLGGQLISKALGGEVSKHYLEEFGWSTLYPENNQLASEWLAGISTELKAIQWHSDSFTIPEGATRILNGEYCENQAFVYGKILAMQFHIEIEAEMIKHWALNLSEKHPSPGDGVQTGEQIMKLLKPNFDVSQKLATHLYTRWLETFSSNTD